MSFVLIHGAGYGANCWDPLLPHLAGDVLAVDLPGRGSRSGQDLRTVTLQQCADAVVADVLARDLTDIVLVGHSFAGVTVPRVMAAIPDRIRSVVLVAAVIPQDGTRVLDQIDPTVRVAVEEAISGGVYSQGRDAAIPMLCNDLDAEQTAWALDRLVDDSAALLTEQVDLSGYGQAIPRTYIRTLQDHCYPTVLQDPSIARVSATVHEMDSGHLVMVSRPVELAEVLLAHAS